MKKAFPNELTQLFQRISHLLQVPRHRHVGEAEWHELHHQVRFVVIIVLSHQEAHLSDAQ